MVLSWFDMYPVCSEFIVVIFRQIMKKATQTWLKSFRPEIHVKWQYFHHIFTLRILFTCLHYDHIICFCIVNIIVFNFFSVQKVSSNLITIFLWIQPLVGKKTFSWIVDLHAKQSQVTQMTMNDYYSVNNDAVSSQTFHSNVFVHLLSDLKGKKTKDWMRIPQFSARLVNCSNYKANRW